MPNTLPSGTSKGAWRRVVSVNPDNPWIADVRGASRPAGPLLSLALVIAVCAALTAAVRIWGPGMAATFGDQFAGDAAESLGPLGGIIMGPGVSAVMLACAQLAARAQGRRLWRREPFGRETLFGGVGLGVGGACAAAALASLGGVLGGGQPAEGPGLAYPLLASLGGIGLQAVAQEALFRGWLQPALCARWGSWPGIVTSALAYAAFGLALGPHDAVTALNLVLLGVILGLLALRSGALVAPICANFAWWGTLDLIFGPGGGAPGLTNLLLQGPVWPSSGATMVGGSLAMTAVTAVLILALVGTRIRRPAPA